MSYRRGPVVTDKANTLGIPIVMPRDGSAVSAFSRKRSEADFNVPPSLTTSPRLSPLPSPSPRPRTKGLNSLSSLRAGGAGVQGLPKGPHAQVVLLKRKRNEEPLDGLLLEMASRNVSDLDLSKEASGPEDVEPSLNADGVQSASVRARKRKKVASARGFFHLAETVEKAKWDNEAWRRDFNERVISMSKEKKKELAAAAGIDVSLDSPVVEKNERGEKIDSAEKTGEREKGEKGESKTNQEKLPPASPVKDVRKAARRYTAVLQSRPQSTSGSRSPVKPKEGRNEDKKLAPPRATISKTGLKNDDSIATNASTLSATSATSQVANSSIASENIVYFNAVPYVAPEEKELEEKEQDEIAAFLPMLQEYLKIQDAPEKQTVTDSKSRSSSEAKTAQATAKEKRDGSVSPTTSDDEYVYDVYFKGSAEPTASDWSNLENYGTLVGLPPQMMDDDGSSDGGDVESEYDQEDDSNDEGFYRNDYPDEDEDEDESEPDSDDFYNERDDSEEEEDYEDDRWR